MRTATNALLALSLIALSITAFAYFSRPSQAQARGTEVVMVSFPMRSGVYYQADKDYEEERILERFLNRCYRIETVIEPTEPNGRPVVIFRR